MSRKRTKLDDLMEAITFAEAGETETAAELAREIFPERGDRHRRILSVSGAAGFSRRMIESSLAMAERLDYGVIALSVPPTLRQLRRKLQGWTRRSAWAPADAFRAAAAERGIPFVHAVRSGDPEKAVAEVSRTFRRIAFLLIDADLAPRARFAAVHAPVFCLDRR